MYDKADTGCRDRLIIIIPHYVWATSLVTHRSRSEEPVHTVYTINYADVRNSTLINYRMGMVYVGVHYAKNGRRGPLSFGHWVNDTERSLQKKLNL